MNNIETEVLIKHRQETRFQSLGMIVGVAGTMFVAMAMIDVIKKVEVMHENQIKVLSFIKERQNTPKLVRNEIKSHIQSDIVKLNEFDLRLKKLEEYQE